MLQLFGYKEACCLSHSMKCVWSQTLLALAWFPIITQITVATWTYCLRHMPTDVSLQTESIEKPSMVKGKSSRPTLESWNGGYDTSSK